MVKFSWSHTLVWVSLAGALAGCSTVPENPSSVSPPPLSAPDTAAKSDEPIPKVEPPSRSGNPDTYVVFGRRYQVRETSEGYREEGIASWYGWEFHGRKTSSGPLFNMFELTAAHKSLPIPTYVQVTNLENGRHIVVKVTDRGPFVGDRAIDLSYAAADRLGMLDQGTARVEIAALAPYQFLPNLAARRAEARELLASRQNRSEPVDKPAAIRFAHATPARPSAQAPGKPPARVLAQVEREKAKLRAQAQAKSARLALATTERSKSDKQTHAPSSVRLALANADHGWSKTAAKTAEAKSLAKVGLERKVARPNPQLASVPLLKGKGAPDTHHTLAKNNQNGKPAASAQKVVGRNNANAVASRTEAHRAGESKPTSVRLASLRMNRPRTIAD